MTFEVEGDSIRIVPSAFTVESVRGSVPALARRQSLKEIEQIAGDDHARHVAVHAFLDFADALAATYIRRKGMSGIYSFNRDFERLPGISREEAG